MLGRTETEGAPGDRFRLRNVGRSTTIARFQEGGMTRRGVVASVLVLFILGGPWRAAMAEPVLYTIEFVASGTVGDEPFVDEPIVVAGVTDTVTIQQIIDNVPPNVSDVQ